MPFAGCYAATLPRDTPLFAAAGSRHYAMSLRRLQALRHYAAFMPLRFMPPHAAVAGYAVIITLCHFARHFWLRCCHAGAL